MVKTGLYKTLLRSLRLRAAQPRLKPAVLGPTAAGAGRADNKGCHRDSGHCLGNGAKGEDLFHCAGQTGSNSSFYKDGGRWPESPRHPLLSARRAPAAVLIQDSGLQAGLGGPEPETAQEGL